MLFLWGVTMVLGDSLQTEEEIVLAGVCWTCIPQLERGYLLCNFFRGFVFKHKLFPTHFTLHQMGLREGTKKCIKNNFYVQSLQKSCLWCKSNHKALPPRPLELVLLKDDPVIFPQFTVGINASLLFKTRAITISRVQQSTTVLKTEREEEAGEVGCRKGCCSSSSTGKWNKYSDTKLWRYLGLGAFQCRCC